MTGSPATGPDRVRHGCGLTDEQIERIVVESRAAQGLPATVERPEAIEKLVVLLRPATRDAS